MSEHDETLRNAIRENAELRAERDETLREKAAEHFAGRQRWAERIYWIYAIVCVVLGVTAINFFTASNDAKSLIACAVLMLVVYETTVLLKLWMAIAGMKLTVLKDMKLLRLDLSRVAEKVGVDEPSEPPLQNETLRGSSRMERRLWLAACVVVAIAASTWSRGAIEAEKTDRCVASSAVAILPDGTVDQTTDVTRTLREGASHPRILASLPEETEVRWLDATGWAMPYDAAADGEAIRYHIEVPRSAVEGDTVRFTRVEKTPRGAALDGDVWTYRIELPCEAADNQLAADLTLPRGAEVVSTTQPPVVQVDRESGPWLRFEATRPCGEPFVCDVEYRLNPEEDR